MGECSWSQEWKTVSVRLQSRNSLGRRHDRKGRLARREGICRKARLVESRTTRPAPVLCTPVSCSRRRTGADPILARPRLGADDGKVSRIQAAFEGSGKRPDRYRTRTLTDRACSGKAQWTGCRLHGKVERSGSAVQLPSL